MGKGRSVGPAPTGSKPALAVGASAFHVCPALLWCMRFVVSPCCKPLGQGQFELWAVCRDGGLAAAYSAASLLPTAPVPQALTGSDEGVLDAQRNPVTPLQRLASHAQEVAGAVASLKKQRAEVAGHAYMEYVLDKQLAFLSDPSNTRFEELELPELIKVTQGAGSQRTHQHTCVHAGTGISLA